MRVLYVTYDFPPNPSPQALRTGQMVLGLVRAGHEVTVLTRKPSPAWPGDGRAEGFRIVHFSPGWLEALLDRVAGWRRAHVSRQVHAAMPEHGAALNWKGRAVGAMRTLHDALRFPGASRSALPHARRAFRALVERWLPDRVVISHEPAGMLPLLRECSRLGLTSVAELGDPVLASYTPRRWVRKAFDLEAEVCRRASGIIVTSGRAAELISTRHGIERGRVGVVTQGYFPLRREPSPGKADPESLNVVYTGRLYPFRSPERFMNALERVDGVKFIIASQSMPPQFQRRLAGSRRVSMAGSLTHGQALELQSQADVLLNLSNRDPVQIPGKFFEYLGTGRPILLVSCDQHDEQAELVCEFGLGWVVEDDEQALEAALGNLLRLKGEGRLAAPGDAPERARFSWPSVAARFAGYVTDGFSEF